MNLTSVDLFRSTEALLGFTIFFIPPGYLLASLTEIANFRTLSLPERLLWSVALSTPLAILSSVMLGRHLSPDVSNAVIYLCAIMFVFLFVAQGFSEHLFRAREWDRSTRIASIAMAAMVSYILLATVGIQVGHRLFESVVSADWSIRVPLVSAAIHSQVPPLSPFYGINGHVVQLRYYYYWYVLCGQMGRILHATPRALLTASSAWSGLALVSIIFLYFKYLFRPDRSESNTSLRRLCLLSLPVSCIIGLDIIPAVLGAITHPIRVYPEMDWWRAKSDFSPSFHTAVLNSPHHTAGLVSCLSGFLVLTLCVNSVGAPQCNLMRRLYYGILAGVCFAAAAGTSSYITLFFIVVCMLFAAERTISRDWITIAALALCGIVAISLSWQFVHEIIHGAGTSVAAMHGNHFSFIGFFPRNWKLSWFLLHMHLAGIKRLPPIPYWVDLLLRIPFWIMAFVIELGFFGFVLAYRLHTDWHRRRELTHQQRFQWVLCISFGLFALFITSSDLIGINDLGRHAGFALRFIAILWATPLIARWLWSSEPWPLLQRPWLRRVLVATIVLGLGSQIWQVVLQRTYFMLVDSGRLVAREPFPPVLNIGSRYFDTRQAFEAIDYTLPADARVQFNPRTSYWALMTIYLNRPVAAGDRDCMSPFGGDAVACADAMAALQALFGGSHFRDNNIPFDPEGDTSRAFDEICSQHHLAAVIATASDRVWPEKRSWVWTEPVLYANPTIRVLACPRSPGLLQPF